MQANAGGDIPDEEIDVTIPKTPAEKMRITAIVLGTVSGALVLGFLIWFFVIPGIYQINENRRSAEQLQYLVTALESNQTDPEVGKILSDYRAAFTPQVSGAQTAPAVTSAASEETSAALTPTPSPTGSETIAAQGVSITPTGTETQPAGEETQAAGTESTGTTDAPESTSPAP